MRAANGGRERRAFHHDRLIDFIDQQAQYGSASVSQHDESAIRLHAGAPAGLYTYNLRWMDLFEGAGLHSNLYRSTAPGQEVYFGSATNARYTDPGTVAAARDVTYYYRVSQVLNGIESDLSDEVAVTIPGRGR